MCKTLHLHRTMVTYTDDSVRWRFSVNILTVCFAVPLQWCPTHSIAQILAASTSISGIACSGLSDQTASTCTHHGDERVAGACERIASSRKLPLTLGEVFWLLAGSSCIYLTRVCIYMNLAACVLKLLVWKEAAAHRARVVLWPCSPNVPQHSSLDPSSVFTLRV